MKLNRRNILGFAAAVVALALLSPGSAAMAVQEKTEQSGSAGFSRLKTAQDDDLRTILDTTRVEDLQPLASGHRSDDQSTAPYDHAEPNKDDMDRLKHARSVAEGVLGSGSADRGEKDQAGKDLKQAFAAVRFIYHYTAVTGTNGDRIFDNKGDLLQAHGAGIQRVSAALLPAADRGLDADGDGYVYVMCGEDKTDGLIAHGVRIYYSDDLCNWVDKGLGFQTYQGDKDLAGKLAGSDRVYQRYYNVTNLESDPDYTNIYGQDFKAFSKDTSNANISGPQQALDYLLWDLKALKDDGSDPKKSSCVFERPKMVYNPTTKRWVIWFHADGPRYGNEATATYSKAKAGVAISEGSDPAGPYKYLGSFRMSPGANAGNPGMARDMNLYVDSGKDQNHDGVDDAYLVYSSNENRDLTISLLDKTYTKLVEPNARQQKGIDVSAGDTYNIVASNSKESPAPFKWNGRYYIIYSGTTGWAPNENKYAISQGDDFLGPYSEVGTPFVKGEGWNQNPANSFSTQSSSVIPYDPAHGVFLYWGDRWFNPDTGNDISQSRYVMTPMQLVNGHVQVLPAADWKLSGMDKYQAIDVVNANLPTESSSVSRIVAALPKSLGIRVGGQTAIRQATVNWEPYFGPDRPYGQVTFKGRLPEYQNAPISFTASIYPENSRLFIDAGSDPSNESSYYRKLKTKAPRLMNADRSDQEYTAQGKWGLSSRIGSDVEAYETSQNGIYETGYWAKSGKDIRYQADLPAGTYTVQAGYQEWWNNKRQTEFSVVCHDKTIGKTNIVPVQAGNATDPITFTLEHADSVTFLTRSTGGGDPLLSWIGVSAQDDDQVVSVQQVQGIRTFKQGSQPGLPDKVSVSKANGKSEERTVHWLIDASNLTLYAPTEVLGTVEGTTLPARASIQEVEDGLSYFIDVNGEESSPTYKALTTLFDGKLANGSADQGFDDLWGNTSGNFGKQADGNADPYKSGIYAGANGKKDKLSYRVLLAPGEHQVSLGFHDWWSQNRPTVISYSYDGLSTSRAENRLTTATVDGGRTIASGKIKIPQGWNKVVTLTLDSSTGTGPILNWISIKGSLPLGPVPVQQRPVISGASNVKIDQGSNFDPKAGVTAVDSLEGDLTGAIQVQGSVNSAKTGQYAIDYTVANSRGKQASEKRIVTVGPVGGSSSNKPRDPADSSGIKPGKGAGVKHKTGTHKHSEGSRLSETGSNTEFFLVMAALSMLSALVCFGLIPHIRRYRMEGKG